MNKDDLITAFRAIGLREGMMLEVHSSLSSFGQVEGGADSVIDALQKDLTRCTVWSSVAASGSSSPPCWAAPRCSLTAS